MLSKIKNSALYIGIRAITLDYFVIKRVIKKYYRRRYDSVLDVGCGIGHLARLFKKKGYLGIDIDPELISLAEKANSGYLFRVGDITNFKTRKKFSFIVVIGVLHHLNNKKMAIAITKIDNLLRKNGKVVIIEAIPPISKYNFIGKILRKLDQGNHIRKVEQYKKVLIRKFKIIDSKKMVGGVVDYGTFIAAK